MRITVLLAILAAAIFVPILGGPSSTASASGQETEGPPPDDLGILLTDMLAAMADTISAHQDSTANESYLGSRASTHRLRGAILHAPDVTLRRGALPLVEGWILDDDD